MEFLSLARSGGRAFFQNTAKAVAAVGVPTATFGVVTVLKGGLIANFAAAQLLGFGMTSAISVAGYLGGKLFDSGENAYGRHTQKNYNAKHHVETEFAEDDWTKVTVDGLSDGWTTVGKATHLRRNSF